jgi:hypothetical protein
VVCFDDVETSKSYAEQVGHSARGAAKNSSDRGSLAPLWLSVGLTMRRGTHIAAGRPGLSQANAGRSGEREERERPTRSRCTCTEKIRLDRKFSCREDLFSEGGE